MACAFATSTQKGSHTFMLKHSRIISQWALIGLLVAVSIVMLGGIVHAQQPTGMLPGTSDIPQNLKDVGIQGFCMACCIVLWKSLQTERAVTLTMMKTVTEALTASSSSNAELRRIIDESVATNRELTESIGRLHATLGDYPCIRAASDHHHS